MTKEKKDFPSLLILGNARHGKDTLAELLRDNFGLKFESSSQSAADIFIYDELKGKYDYSSPEECFEDRVNHRQEWYEMICDYNKDDKARLAKDILKRTDCYVGMRDRGEIEECLNQELFDLIIWVDASDRLPGEPASSFNIDKTCADIVIENNGTYEEFTDKVMRLGKVLTGELIDTSDNLNFMDYFLRYGVIDEDYQFDIEAFISRTNPRGWPETCVDYAAEFYEPVGLRRWDIHSITQDTMELTCAGLSQVPLNITLSADKDGIFVQGCGTCDNWVRGMGGYEIFKILQDPCNNK